MAFYDKRDSIILLVKVTHRCNMNCTYCYDRVNRETIKVDMTMDMVREICRKSKKAAQKVNWIWHGGEYLVMGEKWVKESIAVVKEELGDSLDRIGFQTNGVALTEDLMDFFHQENVTIGISFDGVAQKTNRGDNFDLVKSRLEYAKSKGYNFGPICVLNEDVAASWKENVELFESLGVRNFSFNWVHPNEIESKEDTLKRRDTYIQNVKDFYDFILFNEISYNERILIAMIENIFKSRKCVCSHAGCTGGFLGIGPQGSIYPCDRYYPETYNLGNLSEYENLADVFVGEQFTKVLEHKAERLVNCTKKCDLYEFCNGGCNATSLLQHGSIADHDENWCYVYREIFWHIFNRIKNLSQEEMVKLNPIIRKILIDKGYKSLDVIREGIRQHKLEVR